MTITIEIESPLANQGLGRQLYARKTVRDEMNYVVIGAIIKEESEGQIKYRNDLEMSIEVPADPSQNQTMQGTGTWWGRPQTVGSDHEPCYYYAFTYYIRNIGKHEILFKVGEVEKRLEFEVAEWDR